MTRDQFEQDPQPCQHCGSTEYEVRESLHHPGGGLWCRSCGHFRFWFARNRAEERRPKLRAGTIDQVWAAWGHHCAHCNLTEAALTILGVPRTVQHVPAYKDAGDEGHLIPLCDWCQQDSAARMKRFEALVARLAERRAAS